MSKIVWGLAAVGAVVIYRNLQAVKKQAEDAAAAKAAALQANIQSIIPGIGEDLPGMGDGDSLDNMLLPPPGRTITSSGQVLGDLGYNNDVYDASPYQYRSKGDNDFNPDGLGRWGGGAFKAVSNAVSSVAKAVAAPVTKAVNIVEKPLQRVLNVVSVFNPVLMGARMVESTVGLALKTMSSPRAGWKQLTGNIKSFTITPLTQAGMMVGIVKKPKQVAQPAGGVIYQDANGQAITKEEYEALMTASQNSVPAKAMDYKGYSIWTITKVNPDAGGGVLYLINYDAAANSAEGAYNSMGEAQAAIDAVSVPDTPPIAPSTPSITSAVSTSAAAGYPTFAQAYNGHTISTLTQVGGGVVYLVDVPAGSTYSGSGFASYYPTMAAAQAAIDAAMGGPPSLRVPPMYSVSASSAPQPSSYDASRDVIGPAYDDSLSTPQQSPGLPVATSSVTTPAARKFDPPPAKAYSPPPAPAKSNAGLLVGGGLLAATAAALFMNK